MNQNLTSANEKADELDLIVLLSNAVNFFRRFGFFIAVASIIGLLLGLLFYIMMPKLYPSNLLINSTLTSHQDQIQIINTWSTLLERKETKTLATILNTNPSLIEKVKSLNATNIISNNNSQRVSYQVQVMVTDTSVLDPLQKAIVHGLVNSPYIREYLSVKRASFTELINNVKKEIQKLDSIKLQVADLASQKNASSFIFDVSNINTQLVELYEKKTHYEEELQFLNPVHILQDFDKVKQHQYPKLLTYLLIGFLSGGFIGYLFSIYLLLKNKVERHYVLENQVK